MKISSSDFHLMRWSLSTICASAFLSGVVLYSSSQYAEHQQNNLRTAQKQMNDARKRLTAAKLDKESLSVYSADYGILEKDNVIGDDHRLDWMEGLERLRNQNLVIDFRYNIAPQKAYVPQPAIDSGNFDVHYSETKLQFELLHEGQLLHFFDALHGNTKGHYQLEGCTLKRSETERNAATPMATHIKAECSGGWITLKNRNAQP